MLSMYFVLLVYVSSSEHSLCPSELCFILYWLASNEVHLSCAITAICLVRLFLKMKLCLNNSALG